MKASAVFLVDTQGEQNVIGNHSIDHCDFNAGRGNSYLAAQQVVGLWPERRARDGIDHPAHSIAAGASVISKICPLCALSHRALLKRSGLSLNDR
jgi:hypothetical protein